MRIGFKTTIDEELLTGIKKVALEEKCNVNDILEMLISNYLDIKTSKFKTIPNNFKKRAMTEDIKFAVDRALESYGIKLEGLNDQLVEDFSNIISKIASSNE